MIYVYLSLFIFSIAMGIALLYIGRRQNMTSYALMFIMMSVSLGGYLALADASSLEAAVIANDFVYFGNTMTLGFLLFCISKLTDVRIPLGVYMFMCAFSLFVTALACTAGSSQIYYGEIYLVQALGVSNIGKRSFGPLHSIYYLLLAAYAAIVIALLIYSRIRNRKTSYKNIWLCFGAELISIAFYVIEMLVPAVTIEIVPFGIVIGEAVAMVCIHRLSLYDIASQIRYTMPDRLDYGYIMVDEKLRYLASDERANEFLPALKDLAVDHPVRRGGKELYQDFQRWVGGAEKTSYFTAENGREIRVTATPIMIHRRKTGYLLDLHDDTQQRKYIRLLDNYNTELKSELERETRTIHQMQQQMIYGMAAIVEGRDESTGNHISRTSNIIGILREEVEKQELYAEYPESRGMSEAAFWAYVEQTAPLHDLGKITVSDAILKKPGKLTAEEFRIMQTHAAKGAALIDQMFQGAENDAYREIAMNIARSHHERWDGKGYPDGLKGEEIPVEARLMAVADVYDALCSKRCYKDAYSSEEAEAIMLECFGTQFDPTLRPVFEACMEKLRMSGDAVSEKNSFF